MKQSLLSCLILLMISCPSTPSLAQNPTPKKAAPPTRQKTQPPATSKSAQPPALQRPLPQNPMKRPTAIPSARPALRIHPTIVIRPRPLDRPYKVRFQPKKARVTYRSMARFKRSRYRFQLVTIGQGNWIFTYFGHNAMRMTDYVYQRDLNFNFGTFNVRHPIKLINDYLQFRTRYWLSLARSSKEAQKYAAHDRTYNQRTLLLTDKEAARLARHLRRHARWENRQYNYHHYTSNCSTKLRDAIAIAIGKDLFKKHALRKQGWTYRKHVIKQMRANVFVMLFMDFGMGPYTDKPLTWWEDMFLPYQLEAYLTAPFWQKLRGRPLVSKAEVKYTRKRSPPWNWNTRWLVYSQLFLLVLLGLWANKKDRFRVWLRWIFFWLAGLGSIMAFLMLMTKMPEPPKNANILLYHPFHWVLWWLTAKSRWQEPKTQRFLFGYSLVHIALGLLYLPLKWTALVPIQTNLHYYLYAMGLFALIATLLRPQTQP